MSADDIVQDLQHVDEGIKSDDSVPNIESAANSEADPATSDTDTTRAIASPGSEANSNESEHVEEFASESKDEPLTTPTTPLVEPPPPVEADIPPELLKEGYVDITPDKDGGVLKLVKQQGCCEDSPIADDTVWAHYVAKIETDGTQYDSTYERRRPFKFVVGKEQVIKGWDIGIPTMKLGEVAVLRCRHDYAYAGAGSPPAVPPYTNLVFEIELVDFRGLDVSDDNTGTLCKSRLIQGEEFGCPNEGAFCEIHLTGKYKGRVFDDREVAFVLGEGSEFGLVEGVELGMRRLTRGEKSRFRLHSSLAYDKAGHPEFDIPPNADVDFEILLHDYVKGKEFWDLDDAEKFRYSKIAKDKGTNYFKAGKFKVAKFQYGRVIEYLQFSDAMEGESKVERDHLVLAAHLNLALCNLKLGDFGAAKTSANKALEIDPKSEKALFRRGLANEGLQEYDEAVSDFKAVLEVDRENKAARQQIIVTNNKKKEQRERERRTYAGMFERLAKLSPNDSNEKVAANSLSPSASLTDFDNKGPTPETPPTPSSSASSLAPEIVDLRPPAAVDVNSPAQEPSADGNQANEILNNSPETTTTAELPAVA